MTKNDDQGVVKVAICKIVLKLLLSVVLVLAALWAGTLLVELFTIEGITSLPPGLLHSSKYTNDRWRRH